MLRAVLYVSRSGLPADTADEEVDLIIQESLQRNGAAGISGALVFTGSHFAQFAEGPADEVSKLLERLYRDLRHSHLNIVLDEEAEERRFSGWAMAYSGPAELLARQLEPLTSAGCRTARRAAAVDLVALMQAFTCVAPLRPSVYRNFVDFSE